jgi:hypothetical protein
MSKRVLAFCLAITAVVLCSVAVTSAQTAASATILGRVMDPQGALIPNATVTATKVDTGAERTTQTTSEGLYSFPNLRPGTYDITVEAPHFAKAVSKGIRLEIGDARDINIRLSVAGAAVTVEVTAEAPLIQTTKTDVSTVVNDFDMAHLPVTNATGGAGGSGINDFASLALTAPGVRLDQTGNNLDLVGPGSYNDRGNLINIDGGNISDQVVSTRDAVGASVDEIKEFQVLTNNYNAEYGQAGGLIINAITKSGTNSIHGDYHFFARGRNLSASSFFYNLGGIAPNCPTFPVVEGCPRAAFTKHEQGFTVGGPFIKNKTFWFVSFEKLHIPGLPLTLTPPTGPVTVSQPDAEVMWSVKLDHHLTKNHLISARFNAQRLTQDNLLVQIAPTASPDALVSNVVHDHTLNLSLTSTLTPHLVNEARFFWHRFVGLLPTKSNDPGIETTNSYEHGAFCCPQGAPPPGQNRYQGIDNVSWVHGAHTLKAGVNFSYFPYISDFAQVSLGLWDHGGPFPATAIGGLNPPTQFTIAVGGAGFTGVPGRVKTKDNIYGWYVQDTWKLRPNLTLNYGLRWDYEAGAFKGGTVSNPAGGCFQGNGIVSACSSDKNNFQPRVGIAWAPHFQSGLLHKIFGDQDRSLITASFGEMTQLAYLNISLDSLDFDGFTLLTLTTTPSECPALFLDWPNRPPLADINACLAIQAAAGGGVNFGRVRPISDHLRNPEVRHVNASFQRQLGRDFALNVQYVGAFGFGQFGERDLNFPTLIADTRPGIPAGFFYFGDRPDTRFNPIRTQENSRTSQYNGLLVDVTKRMSHHLQLHAGYTWSHTIASSEDFYGVSEPGDPRNTKAERADAQLDVRHAVNIGAVVDTEKLTQRRGLKWLVNDWSFGWAAQLQSGRPYPISTGDVYYGTSGFFGIGNESLQRPNVLPDGTLSTAGIASAFGTNYLVSPDAAAYCATLQGAPNCPTANTFVAPAAGNLFGLPAASSNGAASIYPVLVTDPTCGTVSGQCLAFPIVDFQFVNGNLKRNAGRTDPYYRADMSITRSFRIPWREATRVELRADFFNLFNHTNFQGFNANDVLDALGVPAFAMQVPQLNPLLPSTGVFVADPGYSTGCTTCIAPLTGQYVGSGGQILHLSDLQHGRVSRDLTNPLFGGIGDPGGTDIPRQIQLSIRVRF